MKDVKLDHTNQKDEIGKRRKILLVEDDPFVLESFSNRLKDENFFVVAVDHGAKALAVASEQAFDIIIADVRMPDMDGIQTIERIKQKLPNIKSILITAYADEEAPIRAIRVDVDEYIMKPVEDEVFFDAIRNLVTRLDIEEAQQEHYISAQKRFYDFDAIVGNSKQILEVLAQVRKLATNNVSVLLLGETGTGKELIARAIHFNSDRKEKDFIAINCAAIPEALVEDEFFGHEKHAFTGASIRQIGMFELANGGTIFLDEIGELNPRMQATLLRILQDKKFRRLGGLKEIELNVRVLAAVQTVTGIRNDLLHRFPIRIELPPLRERKEDLPAPAMHFIKKYNIEYHKKPLVTSIEERVMKHLFMQDWKGNVRELENVISRAVMFAEEDTIQISDLSLLQPKDFVPVNSSEESSDLSLPNRLESLDAVIKRHIEYVLRNCPSKRKAAEILGLPPSTLNDWIKKYQVNLP